MTSLFQLILLNEINCIEYNKNESLILISNIVKNDHKY